MDFWPRVTGRTLEYKLNRTGARTEPRGTPLRWGLQEQVSLPVCTLKRRYRSSSRITNMACFYSVCKEDQCARRCHMLLLSPERRCQSLGSAGIHFQWKWWRQQPGHECFDLSGNQPGLDWVNLRLWEKCAGVQHTPGACNTHSVRLGGSY